VGVCIPPPPPPHCMFIPIRDTHHFKISLHSVQMQIEVDRWGMASVKGLLPASTERVQSLSKIKVNFHCPISCRDHWIAGSSVINVYILGSVHELLECTLLWLPVV